MRKGKKPKQTEKPVAAYLNGMLLSAEVQVLVSEVCERKRERDRIRVRE
jgi:hypothetical protein